MTTWQRMAIGVLLSGIVIPASAAMVEQGRAALQQKDFAATATLLESTVAHSPSNAEAHYELGIAYGRLAEESSILRQAMFALRARDQFLEAVRLDPNHLDARFSLVQYYMLAPAVLGGSEEKALREASEIRKRDEAGGHRAAAFIAMRQNRYKAASDELEDTVRLDPSDMPSWFQIGRLAALTGTNVRRGEEALRKYLGHSPANDEPPLERARYWLAQIHDRERRTTH